MKETPGDLDRLQRLLDESYAAGGAHLREVITPDRRLDAVALATRLNGMSLLVLATVTGNGRPICGPVDGIFYRGSFHFGSSPDSIRFRHLRQRPAVSATHLDGEEFSVTVHGTATEIDLYVPRYGEEWEQFIDSGPVYARIDARRMFTFFMPADAGLS